MSSKSKRNVWGAVFAIVVVVLSVLAGFLAGRGQLGAFLSGDGNRGAVVVIFALASFFPISAIAYQLFQRDTQIDRLESDFCLLGIDIPERYKVGIHPTAEEYHDYIQDVYKRSYDPWNYVIHCTLAALVAVLGLTLFFGPPVTTGSDALLDVNTLQAMRYGFIGAYIFSFQLVYRRYRTLDLQPAIYMYCTFTLIAGLAFNYVALEAISDLAGSQATQAATGLGAGILAIVAFSLGYFPHLAIRWFDQVAHTALGMGQRRANELPLGLIDGISQLHETRLRDEGIDNVQNLASAPIGDLLINTRFSAQQLIEWVDQAALYLYLDPNEIVSFRRGGARCISDLFDRWGLYYVKKVEKDKYLTTKGVDPDGLLGEPRPIKKPLRDARKERAPEFQSTPERLDAVYCATREGPNIAYIENYWRNSKILVKQALDAFLNEAVEAGRKEGRKDFYEEVGEAGTGGLVPEKLKSMWGDEEWHEGAETADAMLGHARVAAAFEDFDEAIATYRRIIEQYPHHSRARNGLAWLYADELPKDRLEEKHLDEAVKSAEEAIRLAKTQEDEEAIPSYLDTLAKAKIELARRKTDSKEKEHLLDEAEQHLREAEAVPETQKWTSNPLAVRAHLREIADMRQTIAGDADN